jgi:hypothetical protein
MKFLVSSTHSANNESSGFKVELADLPTLIGNNVRQVNTATDLREERIRLFRRVYLTEICKRVGLTWDAKHDVGCGPIAIDKIAELERLLNNGNLPQRPVLLFSQTNAKFWIETANQSINQVTKTLTDEGRQRHNKRD